MNRLPEPRRIHWVGHQNQGKTTLLVELIAELTRRGFRVGSIKHSGHTHELDTPGKDSHRHRTAGASPAAIITTRLTGVFVETALGCDPYPLIAPLFASCDLILVEGEHDAATGTKLEVWRAACGEPPLAAARRDIVAVISDDPLPLASVPVWPRRDLTLLADRVLELAGLSAASIPNS